MKKLSFYIFAAIIAASAIVSGCAKDPVEEPPVTPPVVKPPAAEKKCYVTKIKKDSVLSVAYTYNTNNKVEKIDYYAADGIMIEEYFQITYTGNLATRIDKYEVAERVEYTTIEYNANNLPSKARIYKKDATETLSEYLQEVYFYNGDKQLTKTDFYTVENGTPTKNQYDQYTYTAGNITRIKTYSYNAGGGSDLVYSIDYTYDTKKNLYAVAGLPTLYSGALMSANNLLSASYKNASGGVAASETFTHTYTKDNYPLSTAATPSTGAPYTLAFEYICK